MIRVACLLIIFLQFYQVVSAKVWHVSTNGKLRDIATAVKAASSGDTILVEAGTYKTSNVIIDKPLFMKGNGFPVLDGGLKAEIIGINQTIRCTLTVHAEKALVNFIVADRTALRVVNLDCGNVVVTGPSGVAHHKSFNGNFV